MNHEQISALKTSLETEQNNLKDLTSGLNEGNKEDHPQISSLIASSNSLEDTMKLLQQKEAALKTQEAEKAKLVGTSQT